MIIHNNREVIFFRTLWTLMKMMREKSPSFINWMLLCQKCLSHHINRFINSCTRLGKTNEPPCDKTYKMTCVPSENSDQLGHQPSLIRVFAVWFIGLSRFPCWSESLLDTQDILLVLSCFSSYLIKNKIVLERSCMRNQGSRCWELNVSV